MLRMYIITPTHQSAKLTFELSIIKVETATVIKFVHENLNSLAITYNYNFVGVIYNNKSIGRLHYNYFYWQSPRRAADG